MTKTYTQLVKQIESLKAEAERARRREMEGVISRIRSAITAYSLTAEDLGFNGSGAGNKTKAEGSSDGAPAVKRRRRRGTGPAPKPARDVKFSNGSGGTWGGRGKRPQWLRDALSQGKSLEDFLVK